MMVDQEGMEWCWLIKKPCLIKKAFVWLIKKALLHHYSHDKYTDGKASAASSNWHREVEVILMRYQISTLKWKGSREYREHNMERGGNTWSSTSITVMQKCTYKKFHNKTPHKSLSTQNQTKDLHQQIPAHSTSVVHFKTFHNKTPHKSLDPESNRGPTD